MLMSSMRLSAKRSAYSDMPSDFSHSAIVDIPCPWAAVPRRERLLQWRNKAIDWKSAPGPVGDICFRHNLHTSRNVGKIAINLARRTTTTSSGGYHLKGVPVP